jgi:hypothetical protein
MSCIGSTHFTSMAAGCNFARTFSRTCVPYRCHSNSKGDKR